MTTQLKKQQALRRELYRRAFLDSFRKLDPRWMVRNPVMFVVEVGSVLTTFLWVQALIGEGEAARGFIGAVAIWLWFTVLFANFSEALAEGRGKAQADALRRTRQETHAKKLHQPRRDAVYDMTPSTALRHPVARSSISFLCATPQWMLSLLWTTTGMAAIHPITCL